jgi:tetratricopeptide (TPR) repeat protein
VRRPSGPPLPDWADPRELDQSVRAALRGLDPRNAELVAKHLVVAGTLVDEDPEQALAHARAARDRASRIAVVREAVGVAAYHAGDYAEAARELRAYRRMSGDDAYRPVLADCERALGRPEVALRLVAEALAGRPHPEEAAELRLVEAGARRDLGETAAARLVLQDALGGRPDPAALAPGADPARIRLAAAYADLLEADGDAEAAQRWRDAVLAADPEGATGAVERPDVEFGELDEDVDGLPGGDLGGAGPDDEAPDDEAPDDEAPDDEAPDDEEVPGDELGEEVPDEDIEAEVAELLGEDPPAR